MIKATDSSMSTTTFITHNTAYTVSRSGLCVGAQDRKTLRPINHLAIGMVLECGGKVYENGAVVPAESPTIGHVLIFASTRAGNKKRMIVTSKIELVQ
jgi:hypothetical protein